jgi:hypothetical protein
MTFLTEISVAGYVASRFPALSFQPVWPRCSTDEPKGTRCSGNAVEHWIGEGAIAETSGRWHLS